MFKFCIYPFIICLKLSARSQIQIERLESNNQKFLIKVIQVGLSTSKKKKIISFNESSVKMMKNTFYFILKALFVLKILKLFSWRFGYVEKRCN